MEIDCYKKAISRRGGGQQSLAQSKRKHPLSADCEFDGFVLLRLA
jgi:hypothetical protein